MHRLAATPGEAGDEGLTFVEQPPAPVVFLSSAATDLAALDALLAREPQLLGEALRGLPLAALAHPAVIDHYVSGTLATARLVVVRLLGGRGHWSYGLEQLQAWQRQASGRQLLVLAGTADEERSLAELGSLEPELALALARALREGGEANLRSLLRVLRQLLDGQTPEPPLPQPCPDPLPHDWRQEPGTRVGLILYRALHQAGDLALAEAACAALRAEGLAPRALWVSSLRDAAVQSGVGDLLEREGVQLVICSTSFASVRQEEAGLGAPLWERLGVPVLQLLTSSRPEAAWRESSIGLAPLDLSLQIALPELDGRITTRVGAFREPVSSSESLATGLSRQCPDPERLGWIAALAAAWCRLRGTPAPDRRVALVLANYPTRDSRLANGVGLDTPASTAAALGWLQQAGYGLEGPLPADGDALIRALLAGRSNDPASSHRPALAHLPLSTYVAWYHQLPAEGRQRLEAQWGPPAADADLEAEGFPVQGLRFGNVVVLIQPDRGVDRDPARTYHCPDLPPTHAYLARYLWLRQSFGAHVVVHVGKHGNLEWLPGKGVGLSSSCFPEWALGPLPHLYPFIVNDPGEGSQAKRRAQAVILDHLTPPLGRAGLHGELLALEGLLEEYWQAVELGGERATGLRQQLLLRLAELELPQATERGAPPANADDGPEGRIAAADGYLCELKEAQIRLGLHVYGHLPPRQRLAELLLCLARAPQEGMPGLTQALALDLGLDLDPWADPEEALLAPGDRERLQGLPGEPGATGLRHVGDGVARLEAEALRLVMAVLEGAPPPPEPGLPPLEPPPEPRQQTPDPGSSQGPGPISGPEAAANAAAAEPAAAAVATAVAMAAEAGTLTRSEGEALAATAVLGGSAAPPGPATGAALEHLRRRLLPALLACGQAERAALLTGLAGGRIAAGPSGAPTRGRPDLLPTGRNFYSVDLRGLPTEAAWDLGRRSAALLLDLHLQEQGEDLRTLALSVWGTATMRNGGEDIAQALALMGVQPVWDGPSRRMVNVELIPLAVLGRPRVDVTLRISGLFRDAFPQLVGWFNRACRLVAAAEESAEDNPLAAAARLEGETGRVFGSAPGAYGAGLQALIDGGQWERRQELGEAFLAWSGWRYDGDAEAPGGLRAEADRGGLERRLQAVQVVLHNQDNREHDLLDSDDYYQFQGGLSAAVETLRGEAPALWFADHSRSARPRIHRLEKEFDKVVRSRLLNPRWIEGMQRHGYKGGFEMAASLDYLFAYDAATGRVPDWSYGALCDRWLAEPDVLAFLRGSNPWALRDMAERLLEAHHRGLWDGARAEQLDHLRALVLDSEGLVESL